jgi:hypothetical protein
MFWEELIAYSPFIRHGPHRKRRLQQIFVAAGTCLLSHCLAMIGGYTERPTLSALKRHGQHRERRVQQFVYCCVCIRCRGKVFTEPLPTNDRRIHIQTHRLMGGIYEIFCWDGLRCHDIHTNFHKDWFRHSKADSGTAGTPTHRQDTARIGLLLFFENKESWLII